MKSSSIEYKGENIKSKVKLGSYNSELLIQYMKEKSLPIYPPKLDDTTYKFEVKSEGFTIPFIWDILITDSREFIDKEIATFENFYYSIKNVNKIF